MNTEIFKKRVKDLCDIAVWHPSEEQLKEIARKFVIAPPATRGEALEIVQAVCQPVSYLALEGADNSDLRALLALAMAAAKG